MQALQGRAVSCGGGGGSQVTGMSRAGKAWSVGAGAEGRLQT